MESYRLCIDQKLKKLPRPNKGLYSDNNNNNNNNKSKGKNIPVTGRGGP
jgi:hypothetical protein